MTKVSKCSLVLIFAILMIAALFGTTVQADVTDVVSTPKIVRGPYLQMSLPNSIMVRWRTDVATDSRVFYSQDPANQNLTVTNSTATTEHTITITGLDSNTRYYYKVGTTTGPLSARFNFHSAPDDGHANAVRIWVLGNTFGKARNTKATRDAYLKYTGKAYTHLMLLLGDIPKDSTDPSYQSKLFNVFGSVMANTSSLAALGDNETDGSASPPATLPYYSIFNLPSQGQGGGLASGNERYYSYDYGTIHFVALDSEADDRSPSGPMMTWLDDDLAQNKVPWIIAYWHHSPYSKGNHNSDNEIQMIEMRENANHILENHGVDLVLGAHSKSYERTFLIDGFYGMSNTFSQSMEMDPGDGRVDGDGPYLKPQDLGHAGTVYIVDGTASGGARAKLNHPAMFKSTRTTGSVIIDENCAQMDVKMLSKKGNIVDYFTIRKKNAIPTATITSPSNGQNFSAGQDITINANASDADNNIRRLRFFENTTEIAADYSAPYSVTWNNVPKGDYKLTVIPEDDLCGSSTSSVVTIHVN